MLISRFYSRKKIKSARADKIRNAINDKFLNKDTGVYAQGYQGEQGTAIFWGVVPEEYKEKAVKQLVRRIVEDDNSHINCGLLGSKALLNALSENGETDMAYTVASHKDFPSWGWFLESGGSSLFEHWKAKRTGSGNHIMFCEISAWMYKTLGCINPDIDSPGFKKINLTPKFVKRLDKVETSYESVYGKIVSNWYRKKNSIKHHVTIPANTSASLKLESDCQLKGVKEQSQKKNITLEPQNDGAYSLPAGSYVIDIEQK